MEDAHSCDSWRRLEPCWELWVCVYHGQDIREDAWALKVEYR
jgi:hypothetical protein